MVPAAQPEPVQPAPTSDQPVSPPVAPPSSRAVQNAAWEASFAQLLEFHRQHGHFWVSRDAEHKALNVWSVHQRMHLKAGRLPPERRERLLAAGFPGNPHSNQQQHADLVWDRHFAELMEFFRQHGHFNIPGTDANYKLLWEWAHHMRRKNAAGRLNPGRRQRLEAVGFTWSAVELKWELRFAELAAYQQRFGHCRVPWLWRENPALGRWVMNQRFRRKSGKLSPERIARLARLGFEWEPE